MEKLFSRIKLPSKSDLVISTKAIKLVIFLSIFVICIIIISNTSTPPTVKVMLTKDMTIRANITPENIFHPNIAVIVDFRIADHIVAVVHNVNHHIPSTWPIQIFHGKENFGFIMNSTLAPIIKTGKIFLTLMDDVYDRARTDSLLTDSKFWLRVRGEKILFFQIDSAMCSNSAHKITDFLQYDYIGAPWDLSFFTFDRKYRVGNGGFSFRSRSKLLALLALIPYDNKFPEDVWYAQNLHRVNGSIPTIEVAKTFAVESMYYDRPLGVHRFPWHCQFRADLGRTCPESMMIMPDVCH